MTKQSPVTTRFNNENKINPLMLCVYWRMFRRFGEGFMPLDVAETS